MAREGYADATLTKRITDAILKNANTGDANTGDANN